MKNAESNLEITILFLIYNFKIKICKNSKLRPLT